MPDQHDEQATAREDLCRLLAACYYQPDAELGEEKVFDAMAAAAARLDDDLAAGARRLGEAFDAQDLPTLAADHDRLFAGAGKPLAPPWAGAWLVEPGSELEEATVALEGLYSEAGFEVDQEGGEHPDHVAVELAFLYLLTVKRNEARRAGDPVAIGGWEQLHDLFLRGHLGAWIARFTQAVQANAQTAFHRELAALTERFVRLEAQRPTAD